MKKFVFLVCVLCVTLLGGFFVVYAETTDERKQRLETELASVEAEIRKQQ